MSDQTIIGTAGRDTLIGGDGADLIFGLSNGDMLIGGAGADTLDGGEGQDRASYATSPDAVNLNLATNLGSGGDAEGDVFISIEWLIGSAFDDTLSGSDVSDRLDGGAGDDLLFGGGSFDGIVGGAGDDTIHGEDGGDFLNGGEGADLVLGGAGDDTIWGNAGADTLDGGDGFDTASYELSLAAVTVSLEAGVLGSGANAEGDVLINFERLIGSPFDDTLSGGLGDDTLFGRRGADLMRGGLGNDEYLHMRVDGDDVIEDQGGTADLLFLTEQSRHQGIVSIVDASRIGDDLLISFLEGSVRINDQYSESSAIEALRLDFTEIGTPDRLFEFAQDLTGGTEDDFVVGAATDDVLSGGAGGADILFGGAGNDLFLPGLSDIYRGGAGQDTISYAAAPRTVHIDFKEGTAHVSGSVTERELFSDIENIIGSAFVDVIDGNGADNSFAGGGGNDVLSGDAGADTLDGGGGSDSLFGGDGDDTLIGGAAADRLYGETGTDTASYEASYAGVSINLLNGLASGGHATGDLLSGIENLSGSAHADSLVGNSLDNVITGQAGNDTVRGYGGNDTLSGGSGYDTFIMNPGDGSDVITDFVAGFGSEDVIDLREFTALTSLNDVLAIGTDAGTSTTLAFASGDSLALSGVRLANLHDDDFLFAPVLDEPPDGTPGGETFLGDDGDDTLSGGEGNDLLDGAGGNDALFGAAGADTVVGGDGADSLYGGALMNLVRDSESFGADTAWRSWAVTMTEGGSAPTGSGTATLLSGDSVNGRIWQLMDGLQGGETYTLSFWHKGDNVRMAAAALDWVSNLDIVYVGDSNTWQHVSLTVTLDASDTGFYFQVGGGGQLTLGKSAEIWGLQLNTGATITDYVPTSDEPVGFEVDTAANLLMGGDGADKVVGAAGDDMLLGGGGSDLLRGDKGADTLYGGVLENLVRNSESFGAITAWKGAAVSFSAGGSGPEGTGTSTVLSGTSLNGRIWQLIDGLQGGETYTLSFWHKGDNVRMAAAALDWVSNLDTVYVGDSNTWQHVSLTVTLGAEDTGFYFQLGGGGQLNLGKSAEIWAVQLNSGIAASAYVATADAPIVGVIDTSQNTLFGDQDDDALHGAAGADTAYGGEGSDRLSGYAGADVLYGDAGADLLNGGVDSDVLDGGADGDTLQGGDGDDLLLGGAGTDALFGDAGNDSLDGGSEDDLLNGGDGDDVLNGGAGIDVLSGGAGNDIFALADGGGFDIISDFTAGDRIDLLGQSALSNFNDVLAVATDDGTNTIIPFGAGDSLQISGVRLADLTPDDFIMALPFVPDVTLLGGAGDDSLDGGVGADLLDGAGGNDTLLGATGADTLLGGDGADSLYGGTLMNLVRDSESYGPGSAWGSWAATLEAGDAAPDGSAGFATRLTGTDLGNGRVWQRIDGLEADETYTLSFWHQGDNMRTAAAALDWVSNVDTAFTGTSAEWQQVSLTVTLGAQETGFYFQVGGGGQLGLGKSAQLWGMQLNSGTSATDYVQTTDAPVGVDVDIDANILNGGDGDDRLVGAAGNDTLNGGAGDDVLIGGEGSDLFVFDLQNGMDRIEDFSASEGDLIDATAHGLTDFAAVQGVLSNDGNGDAAIEFGGGNTITLIGVDQNQLTQDDFFFG